jgi:hypothetical protein
VPKSRCAPSNGVYKRIAQRRIGLHVLADVRHTESDMPCLVTRRKPSYGGRNRIWREPLDEPKQ